MAKRNAIARKFYMDGETRAHTAPDNITDIGFDVYSRTEVDEEGKPVVEETITLALDGIPATVMMQAGALGLLQKIGDAYAGKGEEAAEIIHTMIERLQSGTWIVGGSGIGPRPTMVYDAVVAFLEDLGKEVNPERIKERLSTDEGRKAAMANPAIKAQYDLIRLAKAQEKAKASQAAAKAADKDALSDNGW